MLPDPRRQAIDYLVIGHLTRDIGEHGERIGGTAAYAALTAAAFGLRVGIVTSWGEDLELGALAKLPIVNSQWGESTTFESWQEQGQRKLKVHQLAPPIKAQNIPPAWLEARIVHLGPVLGEISPTLARQFEASSLGVTPQGWLRNLDEHGAVSASEWPEADFVLRRSMAAVVSREDYDSREAWLNSLAMSAPILAQTRAQQGALIYHQGQELEIEGLAADEVDAAGAGDIFAAAFFIRLHFGDSLAEAGRVANLVAAKSVERRGIASAPTQDEIFDLMPKAA